MLPSWEEYRKLLLAKERRSHVIDLSFYRRKEFNLAQIPLSHINEGLLHNCAYYPAPAGGDGVSRCLKCSVGTPNPKCKRSHIITDTWRGGEGMKFIESGKTMECPECGIPNPILRVTCEICHAKLRRVAQRGERKMDETAKELYGMNKKLKTAMAAGDQKLAAKVRAQIKVAVAKSEGVFKVGESGLATQAKSTAPKVKAEKKPKVIRQCPCCGEDTGSYFKMGHDGRTHGILIKIATGKMKMAEAAKGVQKMFSIWNKDHGQSMKEVAVKVGF